MIPRNLTQASQLVRSYMRTSPLIVMRLANVGAQFLVSLLTVRLLGLERAGVIFLIQAIWILGRTVGSWGYYWVVLRDRAHGQGGVRTVWIAAVRRIVVINVLLGLAVAVVKLCLPGAPLLSWPLLVCAWAGFTVLGVAALGMAAFLALKRPIRAVSLELLGLPIVQGAPVATFGLLAAGADVPLIVCAQLLLLVSGVVLLCRPLLVRDRQAPARYRLPHAAQAWLLWISDCGTNISLRLPLFVTQAVAGPAAGAVVAVVQQLGMIGSIFSWAAITGAQAKLARALKSGSPPAVRSVMLGAAPLALVMNAVLMGALLLGGLQILEHIYGLSGSDFRWGIMILTLMAMGEGVFGIGVSALNFSGRERLSAALSIGMAVSIAGLAYWLLRMGTAPIIGATLALATCWTVRGVTSWAIGMMVFRLRSGLQS